MICIEDRSLSIEEEHEVGSKKSYGLSLQEDNSVDLLKDKNVSASKNKKCTIFWYKLQLPQIQQLTMSNVWN